MKEKYLQSEKLPEDEKIKSKADDFFVYDRWTKNKIFGYSVITHSEHVCIFVGNEACQLMHSVIEATLIFYLL